MIIRAAHLDDRAALVRLIGSGVALLGASVVKEWRTERQLNESLLSFDFSEGESAGNFIFVAEVKGELVGLIELQSMVGYSFNGLSFLLGKALHRSDNLSVCHEQRVLTLDHSLLGSGCFSLCVVLDGNCDVGLALMQAGLDFAKARNDLFSQGFYVALPAQSGPSFWQAVGERLTAIPFTQASHVHAELFPQSPLFECFLGEALAHENKNSPQVQPLVDWLVGLGFSYQQRRYPIDGGLIYQLVSLAPAGN